VAVVIVKLDTPPSPEVLNKLDPAEVTSQLIAARGVSRSASVADVATPPAPAPPPSSSASFTLLGAAGVGLAVIIGAVVAGALVSNAAAQKPVAVGRPMKYGRIRL
jgi:hypothetical protein